MRLGAALLLLALAPGCSTGRPPPPPEAPLVLHGARLEAGEGLVVHAARATMDGTGAGAGQQVRAVLGPQVASEAGAGAAPPPLQVEAPRSDWDLRARVVRFSGGVVATRGPVRLTCASLEVHYLDAERVDRALAEGEVEVRHGERVATGQRAELHAADGRVVLTGQPQLVEGANTLRGQQITLYLDDERLQCQDCTLVVAGQAIAPR